MEKALIHAGRSALRFGVPALICGAIITSVGSADGASIKHISGDIEPRSTRLAEASWLLNGIDQLPWWIEAEHVDEIAVPDRHQQARTFDGRDPPEFTNHLEFRDFTRRYERVSGHDLDDLRSSRRNPDLLRGRIELVTLAVGRCGYQSREVALLLAKNPGSVTRWLRLGICLQREDPKFKRRLISLEKEISRWGSE